MTRTPRPYDSAAALAYPAGPLSAALAIFWVHGDNFARHPEAYGEAPPTISRALWDPAIGEPFALIMILSAALLAIAITQVGVTLLRLVSQMPGRTTNMPVLGAFAACEIVAVAGMIVLSHYTGRVDSRLHDMGSFMFFFGHAIGISLSGWLLRRMQLASPSNVLGKAAEKVLQHARRSPRHALWIALLSLVYGAIYFGGKLLPDEYFFWQRMILSVTEVIVILAFLAYLQSLWPLVREGRSLR